MNECKPLVIGQHTAYLQDRIRGDPLSVRKLRCLFLKLKSILEMPLLRISQHQSSAGGDHSSTFHLNLSHFKPSLRYDYPLIPPNRASGPIRDEER